MRPPGQHQASWAAPDPGTEPALVPWMWPGLRVLCAQRWGGAQVCCPERGREQGVGSLPRPAEGDYLGQTGGALGATVGHRAPPAQERRLGHWPLKRNMQRQAPGSEGELPAASPASWTTLGRWPGVWGPLHKRGDPNLRLGFQDFSHPVPQCPTWAWEGTRREGAGTPRGPVLVTLALQTRQR